VNLCSSLCRFLAHVRTRSEKSGCGMDCKERNPLTEQNQKSVVRRDSMFRDRQELRNIKNQQEESERISMINFVLSKINEMFIAGIPIKYVRTLPKTYMYTLGAVSYLIFATLFSIFFVTTYQSNLKSSFISLDPNSGQCNEVPSSVSGSYYATIHGEWQGNSNFLYTDAPYYFIFSDMSTTLKNFQSEMSLLNDLIYELGEKAKNQSLSQNILVWAHYRHKFTFEKTNSSAVTQKQQFFQFVGTPNDIFNREFMFNGLGNVQQLCEAFPLITYLKESAMLTLGWNHEIYDEKNCNEVMDAVHAGYSTENDAFTFHIDMITFMTTIALNSQVLNLNMLLPLVATQREIPPLNPLVYGNNYQIILAYDSMYPRMTPVWCLQSLPLEACFLAIPNDIHLTNGVRYPTTYALPIMTHYLLDCEYCSNETKQPSYCSNFDFNIALITFPDETTIFDLALKYSSDHRQLFHDAYPAIFQVLNHTKPSHELYEFCWYNCSILALNIFDYTDYNINPYFFSLNPELNLSGSCSDSFSTSHFPQLASSSNLPAPLTEKYYECDNTKTSSLINAIGIASGNTASFGPILIILILPLMYLYLQATKQVLSYDRHTLHEKEMATQELISYLLRIRDHELEHTKPNGVLVQIVEELREIDKQIALAENLKTRHENIGGRGGAGQGAGEGIEKSFQERLSFYHNRQSRCENISPQSVRGTPAPPHSPTEGSSRSLENESENGIVLTAVNRNGDCSTKNPMVD
jgi:hypothetical protein